MCDDWMPLLRWNLSADQFRQLPRNSAYKYELINGEACLSPRPKHYHALLDLRTFRPAAEPVESMMLRPAGEKDFGELVPLFAAAFRTTQPFGSLDDATRKEAARRALERTRAGGDGPWIDAASFIATSSETGQPVGAILLTLLPTGDLGDFESYYWDEPPPEDAITRRLGRPHLTWIFVSPLQVGRGTGTLLLTAAVRELRALGYDELVSTFMIGNDSSMLWHWRCGFQLLAYPGSVREMHRRWQR